MKPNQITGKVMCVFIRNNQDILVGLGYDNVKAKHFGRILGGTIELQEKAEVAMRREIREELNCEIDNLRFIKVIENIFTYQNYLGHEIVFLYQGDLADKSLYEQEKISVIDTSNFEAAWIPIKDIVEGKSILYPELDLLSLLNA